MDWKWERKLVQLGGDLIVTPNSYSTSVYFPGADLRHNGTFWRMTAGEVGRYIDALGQAWERFEQLAAVAPEGADMNAPGSMDIGIHIARWPGRGVTLYKHHSLIATKSRLDGIIAELRGLPALAAQVQTALNTASL